MPIAAGSTAAVTTDEADGYHRAPMARSAKRYMFDPRVTRALRDRLEELDTAVDEDERSAHYATLGDAADLPALHVVAVHQIRCPMQCEVNSKGRRAAECAIAEALRVISRHTAHVREPEVLDLIWEASKVAAALRLQRTAFRKKIRAYARLAAPLHPDPFLSPRGPSSRQAAKRYELAIEHPAITRFMGAGERGQWTAGLEGHDHRACTEPFATLSQIDALVEHLA